MAFAPVPRYASKIAWSLKKQSSIGTPLTKSDLTRFVKLSDPVIINESAEHWTDKGMVGTGHEFETERGKLRQFVQFEIPVQPLSVDFIGYLVGLAFSTSSPSVVEADEAWKHESKFTALATRPEAYFTTFAMYEDGTDQCVQGVACENLTIRGDGSNRLECGGSFLGVKIGTPLSDYSWPDATASRFLYNYAGTFELDSDITSQLRNFEFTVNSGINLDLAFVKTSTESDRIYPARWPLTTERNFSLSVGLIAVTGDIDTFRSAQQDGTEIAVTLSCIGSLISTVNDEVDITVPKAVITEPIGQDFGEGGVLHLDLTFDGHYDTTDNLNSPVKVDVTNSINEYFPSS